jgi:hypothetical protein
MGASSHDNDARYLLSLYAPGSGAVRAIAAFRQPRKGVIRKDGIR